MRRYKSLKLNLFAEWIKKNATYILYAILILGGMAIGASFRVNFSNVSYLFQTFILGRQDGLSLVQMFLSSFSAVAILLLIAYLLGLSSFGLPVILAIPVFRGIGVGMSIGYIYNQYGFIGISACVVCILPNALISSIALILACRDAGYFSVRITSLILPFGKTSNLWHNFSSYSLRFLIYLLIAAASAFIDMLVTSTFSRYFFKI